MIRTTISKIKRVLYVSRILRGDNRATGKFEQFYNGLRQTSNKSTNSSSDDGDVDVKVNDTVPLKYGVSAVCEECVRSRPTSEDGIAKDPSFQNMTSAPLDKIKENHDKTQSDTNAATLYKRTSRSKFEEREKILQDIFGDMNTHSQEPIEEKGNLEPEIVAGSPKSNENPGTIFNTVGQQIKEDTLKQDLMKEGDEITRSDILNRANAATSFYKCVSDYKCDDRDKVLLDIFGKEMSPQQAQLKVETDNPVSKLKSDNLLLGTTSQQENEITDATETELKSHNLLLDTTFHQEKEIIDQSETKATLDDINYLLEPHVSIANDNDTSIEAFELIPDYMEEQEKYNLVKEDFINHLCHGVIMMDADNDKSKHIPPTLESVVYNNLYDGDPEEMQEMLKSSMNHKEENYLETRSKHIEIDPYWSELYQNNMVENCMYYEPQMPINPETLKIFRALRRQGIYDPREPVYSLPCYTNTEFMTTITEDQEILSQKLERIDETPVVETEKTKIDDINTIPKVLGNKENINFDNASLDEVETECLKFDNKYETPLQAYKDTVGFHNADQKSTCAVPQDTQGAPLNKPRKPTPKKEIELEIPFVKREHTTVFSNQKNDDLELSAATLYIQRTDTSNVTPEAEANQPSDQRQPKPKLIDLRETWAKKQLDSTHVLTCNETCAISPKSLLTEENKNVETTETNPIVEDEDTQSRYDMSSAVRKERIHAQEEYIKHCLAENPINTEPFYTTYRKIRNLADRGKEESFNKIELNTIKAASSAMATGALAAEKTYPMEWPKQVYNVPKEDQEKETFSRVYLGKQPDITEECIVLDKIKRTSEQLQATSQQLLATEERMQVTSEILKDTTEQLIATSDQLHASTEKLIETAEMLNVKETEPNDTCADSTNHAVNYITATTSNLCAMKTPLGGNSKAPTAKPGTQKPTSKTKSKQPTKDGCSSLDSLAHQGAAMNPAAEMTDDILSSIDPIPDVNDKVRLSEIMRKVRERNKLLESCRNTLAVPLPAEGKITKKPCTPHSQPMAPPTWTSPNYPQPARQFPRICVPKKKSGKPKQMKCSVCDTGTLAMDPNSRSQMNGNEAVICPEEASSVVDLTEDFVTEIQTLGRILEQGVAEVLEGAMVAKSRRSNLFKAKDYEPWSPIPSWPYAQKEKKKKLQCPKDGCPYPPPCFPCLPGLPMGLKPCDSLPTFPKRSCSLIEFFTVTIGDHKVVDLGEF